MRIKNAGPVSLFFACIVLSLLWLFAAPHVPVMDDLWRGIGKPDAWGRFFSALFFIFAIFAIAAKILKPGPM
ncbi:MAG: hypothetical protein ACOCVL_01540 [Candidatus Sumerlaeota bacterium]